MFACMSQAIQWPNSPQAMSFLKRCKMESKWHLNCVILEVKFAQMIYVDPFSPRYTPWFSATKDVSWKAYGPKGYSEYIDDQMASPADSGVNHYQDIAPSSN